MLKKLSKADATKYRNLSKTFNASDKLFLKPRLLSEQS